MHQKVSTKLPDVIQAKIYAKYSFWQVCATRFNTFRSRHVTLPGQVKSMMIIGSRQTPLFFWLLHTPHLPVHMRYTSQHMEQQDVAVLD